MSAIRRGRPPRPPSEDTVARLRRRLEWKQRAELAARRANDVLCIAVYEACENASLGEIALRLGVGKSTVKGWRDRGWQIVSGS